MGIFDFLKKNKNIENDNGLNIIYKNNGRGYLYKIFEKENGLKHGLLHSYNDIGELHYSQLWRNGEYGGPRYRKSVTTIITPIAESIKSGRTSPLTADEEELMRSTEEKVKFYKDNMGIYSEDKKTAFYDEKNHLMKLQQEEYPSIKDVKGTAWENLEK